MVIHKKLRKFRNHWATVLALITLYKYLVLVDINYLTKLTSDGNFRQ